MSRLVVVSNRVAPVAEGQTAVGGLAVAVLAALRESDGIWFGWNGETVQTAPAGPDIQKVGPLTYATMPITRRDGQCRLRPLWQSSHRPQLQLISAVTRLPTQRRVGASSTTPTNSCPNTPANGM